MNETLMKLPPQSRYKHFHYPQASLVLLPTQSPRRSGSQAITDLLSCHKRLDFSFLEFQINGIIQHILFCVCLLALGIFFASFIHFVAFENSSFPLFFLSSTPSITQLHYGLFTFSIAGNEHLSCFQFGVLQIHLL